MSAQPTITVDEFLETWLPAEAREAADAQTHFNQLCAMLGVDAPHEDMRDDSYVFEKQVERADGSRGKADVWKRGCFGWEYKSAGKNLSDAYQQLLGYREGLGNPPLLVVSDMQRFEIHTNFTNTDARLISFNLSDLRDNRTHITHILRNLFLEPENLHPEHYARFVTETAAAQFAEVADALRSEGNEASLVARFLNRLIFCFFAESVGLTSDITDPSARPVRFALQTLTQHHELGVGILPDLFDAMARQERHFFGPHRIRWFNGGLFDTSAPTETFPLTGDLATTLLEAAVLDWSQIDPSIMGVLFERGLDPKRRAQFGAHYTDEKNIMRVIEPILLRPLRAEFEQLKRRCGEPQDQTAVGEPSVAYNGSLDLEEAPSGDSPTAAIRAFHKRLAELRVLDPACGSGNFLYVALRELKTLEQDVIEWAARTFEVRTLRRSTGPHNLLGIDSDPFAVDLTRVSLWIGELQWAYRRGIRQPAEPILGRIDQIECRDAILAENESGEPVPAAWPDADYIIGNPPFLGTKKVLNELGVEYADRLRTAYDDALDARADLCVYWHELARRQIERGVSQAAGLLATNSIVGPYSRPVLERINESGRIFFAYSDEEWVNDGAALRISIVGQTAGNGTDSVLDEQAVSHINPNLTSGPYVVGAPQLAENERVAFTGDQRTGPFDIPHEEAERMLAQPLNVNGRPNDDVIFPFVNAHDLAQRPRDRYIIDFGLDMARRDAAYYEEPYEHVKQFVLPERERSSNERLRSQWWLHESWRPGMRAVIGVLDRYIATPITSKHRFYTWLDSNVVPDATVVAIARDDDYVFGVLHSRIHELWALAHSTRLADGTNRRYVHTQCFNTFPFPWPLNRPDADLNQGLHAFREAIAEVARTLHVEREQWLNPDGTNGTLLQTRTMTELYNRRFDWLAEIHRDLDAAVAAAYGWPEDISRDEILDGLLALNRERAGV